MSSLSSPAELAIAIRPFVKAVAVQLSMDVRRVRQGCENPSKTMFVQHRSTPQQGTVPTERAAADWPGMRLFGVLTQLSQPSLVELMASCLPQGKKLPPPRFQALFKNNRKQNASPFLVFFLTETARAAPVAPRPRQKYQLISFGVATTKTKKKAPSLDLACPRLSDPPCPLQTKPN